jgi:hypothetical protein
MLLTSLLFFAGCTDQTSTPTAPPTNSSAPLAKLSDIQVKLFNNTCAVADCHAASSNQGNLTLTSGQSYSNLVNVQSVLYPQYKRVQPGDGANSLLVKILKGEVSLRMPLNQPPLPNEVIDSIEAWINNGALNN